MRSLLAIAACLAAISTACGQDTPKPDPSADQLAARSLHHSVLLLRNASNKPIARAARMVALAEFARRLAPDDPDINNTIAYMSLVRKKEKDLAKSLAKSLSARRSDHALGLQWLAAEMKLRQDAQSRSEFLSGVVGDEKRAPELRAASAVHLADILIGQGFRKEAGQAFETAVKLDPYLPAALSGQLALADKADPADRAKIWVRELTVNPHSIGRAVQLGGVLDAAGLYTEGARFYNYAWKTGKRLGLGRKAGLDFAVQHCNALLNAGEYKKASEIYGPISRRFSGSVLLRVLLIEACNNSAQSERAKLYIGEIEAIFAPKTTSGTPDASAAAELAWLYLITGSNIQQALDYARRASLLKPRDPDTVRAMAAAQLVSGRPAIVKTGRDALKKLADKDVFAAAFLAEHYFRVNRDADGEKMLLSGLALSRSGQAARRLRALAKKHGIAVPDAEGSAELKALADSIPESLLEFGLAPEKSLTLKLTCPERIDAGVGIVVRAELASSHAGPLAVGLGGMVPAVVSFDVTAKGRGKAQFKDVVRLVMPAGRYLRKGQKTSVSGRIDVGKLHKFLSAHPLDDFELTISPRLVEPGAAAPGGYQTGPSALASSKPAKTTRVSILGKFDQSKTDSWPSRYTRSLSLIMGDLRVEDLKVRMRAANQIASLLVLSDGMESGKLSPPRDLVGRIDRDTFVLMAAEVLKNPNDAVRAEMLSALGQVKLDAPIIRNLAVTIKDPSALVRFRLVELLGASGLSGQEPIINHFTKDKYDLVADLAKAMQTGPKLPARPLGR